MKHASNMPHYAKLRTLSIDRRTYLAAIKHVLRRRANVPVLPLTPILISRQTALKTVRNFLKIQTICLSIFSQRAKNTRKRV